MALKNLDEKRRLAKMSRGIGKPDLKLEESIRLEEELNSKLFKVINHVEEPLDERDVKLLYENLDTLYIEEKSENIVEKAAKAIKPSSVNRVEPFPSDNVATLEKQIKEILQRMNTMSWGGGGTGVVRFVDLDDKSAIFARMDSKVYTFYTDTPPISANGRDQWINSASGLHYTNLNEGFFVDPVWVEFGPTSVANTTPVGYNEAVLVTTDNYSMTANDYYVGVNYPTGNVAITLPENPVTGKTVVVKDESGNCGNPINWIDVYGEGGDLVDGDTYVRLQVDYGSLTFLYRSGWRII